MKKVMKKFTDINLAVNNLVAAANADYTDRSNYNYEDKTDVQKKIKNEMDDKFVNAAIMVYLKDLFYFYLSFLNYTLKISSKIMIFMVLRL